MRKGRLEIGLMESCRLPSGNNSSESLTAPVSLVIMQYYTSTTEDNCRIARHTRPCFHTQHRAKPSLVVIVSLC